MSILVWALKRDSVQGYLVPPAVILAQPQPLHIMPKNKLLKCFIMEHLLTATNTFSNDDDRNTNIYTCNYNGCHESLQIDYIMLSDRSPRSRIFDPSATASDHWGLTATIRERYGKTPGKRHFRKPIGWECNDHIAFNNTVRTQLNEGSGFFGQELRLSDNPSFALHIYTDDSAREESRTQKCAGWNFTSMTKLLVLETRRWLRPVDQCKSARVRNFTSTPQESRTTLRRCMASSKHFSGWTRAWNGGHSTLMRTF